MPLKDFIHNDTNYIIMHILIVSSHFLFRCLDKILQDTRRLLPFAHDLLQVHLTHTQEQPTRYYYRAALDSKHDVLARLRTSYECVASNHA